ncbi:MAG: DUF2512 family protein [Bacillota bacterium]
MEHVRSLVIKFVIYAAILSVAMWVVAQLPITAALVTALIVAVLTYVIGDLWLLPNYGNIVSSFVNAVMAGVAIWLVFLGLFPPAPAVFVILVAAVLIGIADYFYHQYLKDALFREKETPREAE